MSLDYVDYEGCLEIIKRTTLISLYDYAQSIERGSPDLEVRGWLLLFLDGNQLVQRLERCHKTRVNYIARWESINYRGGANRWKNHVKQVVGNN